MYDPTRRSFLQASAAASAAASAGLVSASISSLLQAAETAPAGKLAIAPFRFDVTPPMGHGLCGGWIKPVVAVDDPLEAIGFVLLGAERPIVVCAVDWTGILNGAHRQWREVLADAAGTTADRVAVQCVHQHNAPFACLESQAIVAEHKDLPPMIDVKFFGECLARGQKAVAEAVKSARPISHVATGQAQVKEVASNRRFVGADGKIEHWRGSAAKDAKLRELPEGLIDPWLKTVAFCDGERPIVACHYYATHPMSFYGDGRVTSDFVGLARNRRQQEQPDTTHIYFTGCSGNVAAGKYNDGTPAARERLTLRIYEGIVAAEKTLAARPIERVGWQTREVAMEANPAFDAVQLAEQIANAKAALAGRLRPAFTLAFQRRCQRGEPIGISALHINDATLLHLPAESFLEYQLRAQAAAPKRFVATAAYGDGGPWYIPTADAYPQGGYEVSVAFSAASTDERLTKASRDILA
jgi:hypothetical protein